MSERVLAVVVSYNPEPKPLERALLAVEEQGCDILIVDNASSNIAKIESLAASLNSTTMVGLADNKGLGAAHNTGITHARVNNYDYVLLLDQDSVPLDGMVERLLKAHRTKSRKHRVSAVGATYLNADNGSESFFIRFGALKFKRYFCGARDKDHCINADFLISSGSLISLETLSIVGEMDETLFIDHVDTEWFLRARHMGLKAFGVCEAMMQHGLGETTHNVNLGGRQRNVPQHKPFRYYYIFRNSILLYRRGYTSWLWKWNDLQRLGMILVMFGLLKAPRRQNLGMMLRGVRDGLRRVTGSLDA